MAHKNFEWVARIKSVERQYAIMKLAVDRLLEAALPDPTMLRGAFKWSEIGEAAALLEATYVIRLFAEFETGVRSFWQSRRNTHPPMRDLLDSVASTHGIPDVELGNAQKARSYRNTLVNDREEGEPIPLSTFRKYLCMYFRHIPPTW